jgi:predicted permease
MTPDDPREEAAARALDEELRFHHEQTLAELRAKGLSEDEARRAAARRFGDRHEWRRRILASARPHANPRSVAAWSLALFAALGRDVRLAGRSVIRAPLFALSTIGVFALQATAATVMFALLNAMFVAPMPYPDADRLVYIWGRNPNVRAGFTDLPVSDPDLDDWRRQARLLAAAGGAIPNPVTLTGAGDPERLAGVAVTGELFDALNVRPLLGRGLRAADQLPGARAVVVIDYTLWQRRFGAVPDAVGRVIALDESPHEIVGVMPKGFSFPRVEEISANYGFDGDVAAYVPWHPGAAGPPGRSNRYIVAVARIAAGVSTARAEQEIRTISDAARGAAAATSGDSFTLVPFRTQAVSGVSRSLWLLGAAVLALVAIGCLNLTHLLLVRVGGRRREFAVRAALGAGRAAIFRHVGVEPLLLAVAGGALGAMTASAVLRALTALAPADLPRLDAVRVDWHVAAASAALLVVAASIVAVASVFGLHRTALERGLRSGSRGATASGTTSRILVGAEVALSILLLLGAGLVVRSFDRLLRTPPGFDAQHVLSFRVSLPATRYPAATDVRRGYDALLARIAGVPGVTQAAYTWQLPMTGTQASTGYVRENGEGAMALIHRVSPTYFQAMGMRVVRGCGLDCHVDLPAAVINQAMERTQWADRNPVGEIITVNAVKSRIVGVVSDVRHGSLEQAPAPELYRAAVLRSMYVVVRASQDDADVLSGVRRAVAEVDPSLPLADVRTLEDRMMRTTARRRFTLVGLTAFAALATGLTLVGVYGVTALLVTRLRREVGIRMVLGATPAGAVGLLMRRNVPVILAGAAAGTGMSLALGRYLSPFLYETSPSDPATYAVVIAALTLVAFVATLLPARRAARVQPVEVLSAD